MGELSSNYVNFTLLNWEVWKVVNNISQKPKRYIQVTLLKMIYICVCVCVCVSNYQISDWVAIFKICPIQAFNVSGLQVTKSRSKGFWNGRVTVKSAGQNQSEVQAQCLSELVDGRARQAQQREQQRCESHSELCQERTVTGATQRHISGDRPTS